MNQNEPVRHLMTTFPATVSPQSKPSEVMDLMTKGGFHHVPVISGKKLVGIISSTDLMRATFGFEGDIRETKAILDHTRTIEDLMQTSPVTIDPGEPIRRAAEILSEGWFHSLPVVEDGDLVGMVTTSDLVRYLLAQYGGPGQ